MEQSNELEQLTTNLTRRLSTFNKYKDFIRTLGQSTGKNSRFRKNLAKRLFFLARTLFESLDEEYYNIQKYGRGMWDINYLRQSFNEVELETIKEIAEGYGAFSY